MWLWSNKRSICSLGANPWKLQFCTLERTDGWTWFYSIVGCLEFLERVNFILNRGQFWDMAVAMATNPWFWDNSEKSHIPLYFTRYFFNFIETWHSGKTYQGSINACNILDESLKPVAMVTRIFSKLSFLGILSL